MKWSSQPCRPMVHKIIDMASPGQGPYSEFTDNSMHFLLFSSPVLLDQHFPTHFYFFRTGREINSLHLFIRITVTDMAQQLSRRRLFIPNTRLPVTRKNMGMNSRIALFVPIFRIY